MKKIFFLCVILNIAVSVNSASKNVISCNSSLRYMFAGETLIAESCIPIVGAVVFSFFQGDRIFDSVTSVTTIVATDVACIIPFVVGISLFMKGMKHYKIQKKSIHDFDKLIIFESKIRMFRTFSIISGIMTGIGTALFTPGVFTATLLKSNDSLVATVPLMLSGGVCVALSLPMFISSVVTAAWIRGEKSKISPVVGLSRDEERVIIDNLLSGYSVKVGVKVNL